MKISHVGPVFSKLVFSVLGLVLLGAPAFPAPIQSVTTVLGGPTISNFEGFPEGNPIAGPPGVAAIDQPFGGLPRIDNSPFANDYLASSGTGVLTGSVPGAAIRVTFVIPRSAAEIFLSDTAPAGPYAISAFGAGATLLETFLVLVSVGQGLVLPGQSTPRQGLYVGFIRPTADIVSLGIGHGGANPALDDAFALDDLRASAPVPEPMSIVLVASGLAGRALSVCRRKRRRRQLSILVS